MPPQVPKVFPRVQGCPKASEGCPKGSPKLKIFEKLLPRVPQYALAGFTGSRGCLRGYPKLKILKKLLPKVPLDAPARFTGSPGCPQGSSSKNFFFVSEGDAGANSFFPGVLGGRRKLISRIGRRPPLPWSREGQTAVGKDREAEGVRGALDEDPWFGGGRLSGGGGGLAEERTTQEMRR